jgi:drug/metabolite transporter (DMT)-like permease
MAGVRFLIAGALLFPIALLTGDREDRLTPRDWRSALVIGVLLVTGGNGVLTFAEAYVYLNRKVSPQAASSYAYVNPLVAVALGWGFLGETVTATTLAAGALIVIAVAVLLAGGRRASASAGEATCMEGGQPEVA